MFLNIWHHSLFRFLLVGVLAFALDAGILWFLFTIFELPLWLSAGIGFLTGFVFSYLFQRAFSFRSETPHGRGLLRYLALLGFNTLATMFIVEVIGNTPLTWISGKMVATVITTAWNYFLYRSWVFPRNQEVKPSEGD